MWGIADWEPQFVETKEDILALIQRFAPEFVGRKIEAIWTAHLCSDGSWRPDAPVIIRVGGVNYDICWVKFSEVAIARSAIDVSQPVSWLECEELRFVWRENAIASEVVGKSIQKLQLVEILVEIGYNDGTRHSFFTPFALTLCFAEGAFSIFNDFDQNGLQISGLDGDLLRAPQGTVSFFNCDSNGLQTGSFDGDLFRAHDI